MDLHTSKYHNKLQKFYLKYTDYLYALLESISGTICFKNNRPNLYTASEEMHYFVETQCKGK